jgi:hypothetical protein
MIVLAGVDRLFACSSSAMPRMRRGRLMMKSRIRALRRVASQSHKAVVISFLTILVMGLTMILWAAAAPLAASVLAVTAAVAMSVSVWRLFVRRSPRIRTTEEVKRRLGLPVLAVYVRPLDGGEDV